MQTTRQRLTSTSALRVRRLKWREVPATSAMLCRAWTAAYCGILDDRQLAGTCALVSSRWTLYPMALLGGTFVAEADGCILGCISAVMESNDRLLLQMLYVHPDHHRMGIGTRLLEHLFDNWPGIREIRLEVLKHNTGAIAFYQRLGFETYGGTAHATGLNDVPSIYMDQQFTPHVRPDLFAPRLQGPWASQHLIGASG